MEDNKNLVENTEMQEVQPQAGEHAGDPVPEHKDGGKSEKVFTQEELNQIIQERLERERKKWENKLKKEQEEAERKRLEEEQRYKELYEKLLAETKEKERQALEATKRALMAQAGYTEEQITRYAKYITGESEEDIKAELEQLKADIPPKGQTFADPAVHNPPKYQPKPESLYDYGKELFNMIRGRK